MNIVVHENSNQTLRLTIKPTAWLYIGAGLIFIGLGVLALWAIAYRSELTVRDGIVHYEKRILGMFVTQEFTANASDMTDLFLGETFALGPTAVVALKTEDTLILTDLPISDGDKKQRIVDQMSEAITASGEFRHSESGTLPGLILGGVCIVAGLFCLLVLQTVSIVADRAQGVLILRRRCRWLPLGDRRELSLSNVRRMDRKEQSLRTSSHRTSSYQVVVCCDDGLSFPLAYGPMFTAASANEVVRIVEEWLYRDKIKRKRKK